MCMRYMINREDLGKRVTGYMFYDADSKGFTGLTEKRTAVPNQGHLE